MKTNILWLILVFVSFIGCKGGGSDNKELSEQTFGLQIKKVSGDNQVLENPLELASEEMKVKVLNSDGGPLSASTVTFTLMNPDSGAAVLDQTVVTDDEGFASAKIRGGDDFGKQAKVLVKVSDTKLETVFTISIRNKIIPEFVKIIQPTNAVAGIPTSIQLQLVDRNGRISFEDEFQTRVRVVFSTPSGNHTDANKFSPVNAVDRIVEFDGGVASLTNIWAHKAEDVTIQLDDPGDIAVLEAQINRDVDISDTQVLKVVPAAPVKALLEDPIDATTDDNIEVIAKIYDQYDNHAYNYAGQCTIDIRLDGDQPEVNDTTYTDVKTGKLSIASGTGRVFISDSKVETVDISMENPINCGAINSGNPASYASTQDVYFGVGSPAQIVLLPPTLSTRSVDFPITMNLEVHDAGGNYVNNYNGSVKITHDGDESYISTASVINDIVSITNGSALFDMRSKAVEQVVVGLEDVSGSSMDLSSTQTINFTVGAAKQFAFTSASFDGDADNGIDVEVEVRDQYGNRLNSWAGGSVDIVEREALMPIQVKL